MRKNAFLFQIKSIKDISISRGESLIFARSTNFTRENIFLFCDSGGTCLGSFYL